MLWLLLACETPVPVESGPVVLGTLSASATDTTSGESLEVIADVVYGSAFGYDIDNGERGHQMMIYVVSDPEAKCSDVAKHLGGGGQSGSADWDPTPFDIPGECTLTLASPAYVPKGLAVTVAEEETTTDATLSLHCNDAAGEWIIGDTNERKDGWVYDGLIWQGHATAMSVAASGGEGEAYEWSVSANVWEGGYLYSVDHLSVPATGTVSGGGEAEYCGAMGSLPIF